VNRTAMGPEPNLSCRRLDGIAVIARGSDFAGASFRKRKDAEGQKGDSDLGARTLCLYLLIR